MLSQKERAELAQVCYMTIERESQKPADKMNIPLIDACLELANKLLSIQPLSEKELSEIKQRIRDRRVHRRKSFRVRLIAAILALLLLLGTTVYAFTDWLDAIFGHDEIWELPPGEEMVVENNVVEKPSNAISFETLEELANYIDEPIYLPMVMPEEYVLDGIMVYEYEGRDIYIDWSKNDVKVSFILRFQPSNFNEEQFTTLEYEYCSKDGIAFDYTYMNPQWQAVGFTNENVYTIIANDTDTLEVLIDRMILIK